MTTTTEKIDIIENTIPTSIETEDVIEELIEMEDPLVYFADQIFEDLISCEYIDEDPKLNINVSEGLAQDIYEDVLILIDQLEHHIHRNLERFFKLKGVKFNPYEGDIDIEEEDKPEVINECSQDVQLPTSIQDKFFGTKDGKKYLPPKKVEHIETPDWICKMCRTNAVTRPGFKLCFPCWHSENK